MNLADGIGRWFHRWWGLSVKGSLVNFCVGFISKQAEFVAAWRSFHMLSGSTMIYTWRGAIVFLVRATVSANGQITTVDLNPLSSVAQSEAHQDRRVTDTSGALAGHGDETGRLAWRVGPDQSDHCRRTRPVSRSTGR